MQAGLAQVRRIHGVEAKTIDIKKCNNPTFSSDGENLLAALQGNPTTRTRPVFWEWRGNQTEPDWWPRLAVRDGDWKLLCEYDGSKPLLYDLKRDPGESRDLAATEPTTVERLTRAVLAWHRTMPPDNGAALGAAAPAGKKK